MQVHIHKAKIFAYHGIHAEEGILGGWFEVNLTVSFRPSSLPVTALKETVDYTELLNLVKKEMNNPEPLLETVAGLIVQGILAQFSIAEEVNISITKMHPPIASYKGSVGISLTVKRNEL